MAEMLDRISSFPGTRVGQFLRDLIDQSEEPLLSSLKSLDLKNEKIKTSEDLILYILTNKDKEKYPAENFFKSIANLIIAKDIPPDIIASRSTTCKNCRLWILWIVLGAGLFIFFIIFRKRKKNEKKQV